MAGTPHWVGECTGGWPASRAAPAAGEQCAERCALASAVGGPGVVGPDAFTI